MEELGCVTEFSSSYCAFTTAGIARQPDEKWLAYMHIKIEGEPQRLIFSVYFRPQGNLKKYSGGPMEIFEANGNEMQAKPRLNSERALVFKKTLGFTSWEAVEPEVVALCTSISSKMNDIAFSVAAS